MSDLRTDHGTHGCYVEQPPGLCLLRKSSYLDFLDFGVWHLANRQEGCRPCLGGDHEDQIAEVSEKGLTVKVTKFSGLAS